MQDSVAVRSTKNIYQPPPVRPLFRGEGNCKAVTHYVTTYGGQASVLGRYRLPLSGPYLRYICPLLLWHCPTTFSME